MEILILSSLARTPMHGYELKLELRYKHVRWWAKCEHGHLYAALARLERGGHVRRVARPGGRKSQRVYAPTAAGLRRVKGALERLGAATDSTYFDVDLFLHGAFVLDRRRVLDLLEERRAALAGQLAEAEELRRAMSPYVPAVGRLIMDHRIAHLGHEVAFGEQALAALRTEAAWGAHLGAERIAEFVKRTAVPLEGEE
jgi:DNA-binding PadR family transcriptional regulator